MRRRLSTRIVSSERAIESLNHGQKTKNIGIELVSAKDWFKSVSNTDELYPLPSFDYLAGRPVDSVKFAGMDQAHVIERAYVDPYDAKSVGLVCYGGLSDHGGVFPVYTYHLRVNRNAQFVVAGRRPHTNLAMETPDFIPGRWLYGGEMMQQHFGHFMAESSHRTYAATEYFREVHGAAHLEGIVFSSRMGLKNYSRDLLSTYYGIPVDRIRFVKDRPAVIEQLEVRPQGSIIGGSALTSGYMDFLDFHQTQNTKRVAKQFPRKLFLGRSHLTTGGGGIEDEHLLERFLENAGFTSVRPEEYPMLEQLELLRQAELVVGVGGSFVHLYDHLGSTQAAMFLVSRGDPDSFYHDRTVRGKVRELQYYQPVSGRGDSGTNVEHEGRSRYSMQYNMEYLLDAANIFIRENS